MRCLWVLFATPFILPSSFVYSLSPLQAAVRGLWVVFENIAGAPFELLSAIIPLLQDRQLQLPGRSQVWQPLQAVIIQPAVGISSR